MYVWYFSILQYRCQSIFQYRIFQKNRLIVESIF